jgi:hypothetical protein
MSFADDVRSYCIEHYINPARIRNIQNVTIRAGDVHKEMDYRDRMPLICSSLGAHKFEERANVEKLNITGPANGANTEFHFRIIY